jgi:Carboxylesterase family
VYLAGAHRQRGGGLPPRAILLPVSHLREDSMYHVTRSLFSASLTAACLITASAAFGDDTFGGANRYLVTPLVSNLPGKAPVTDPNLQNSWGVTFTPAASPFWISDNNDGLSTLYDGNGTKVTLVVTIPCPPPATVGQGSSCPPNTTPPISAAPTGMVWNPTTNVATAFLVPGTSPAKAASFIWATEDGTISAWTGGLTPADNAVLAVNNANVPNAANGAVYKGLVVGVNVNVWRPAADDSRFPVMVWIYGGSLAKGAPSLYPLDASTGKGIVAVSMNLGVERLTPRSITDPTPAS